MGEERGQVVSSPRGGAEEPSRNRRPLLLSMLGLLPTLRHKERRIAAYILTDPERVISSSIAEIHKGCGASVGAIVAFCHRMGLEGFTNFKIELARDLAQGGLPEDGAQREGCQTLLEQVFRFHANSLAETHRINSEPTLHEIARLLDKASRIEFFSIGISQGVAYTARCKLRLIGLPAYTEFDSRMQVIAATRLKPGAVGFGISYSGSTRETIECLRITRSKQATTICLTNSVKSPITEYADLALYATPSEVNFQTPAASRVTQLAVLDALFVCLALKRKSKTAANLRNAAEEPLKRQLK